MPRPRARQAAGRSRCASRSAACGSRPARKARPRGLILWRYRARNVEFDIYPPIPNRWRFSPYKPSQAMDVVFEGIRPRTPVYIRPYVLGGPEQQSVLTDAGTGYERETRLERELGLDV